jgi:hypothetical protein
MKEKVGGGGGDVDEREGWRRGSSVNWWGMNYEKWGVNKGNREDELGMKG